MSSSIFYYPYELKPRKVLNSRSHGAPRAGALICVNGGYSDIHPWEELGDVSIAEQLRILERGGRTPLLTASLRFAAEDAKAREAQKSLFDGLIIPRSHLSLPRLAKQWNLDEWVRDGFAVVKIKLGFEPFQEIQVLGHLGRLLDETPQARHIQLRLDFNQSLKSSEGWDHFYRALPQSFWDRVDFVEDPWVYQAEKWRFSSDRCRLRLALDRCDSVTDDLGYEVRIVKPAYQHVAVETQHAADTMKRIVITSYMDHPVGQMFAAWEAARAQANHPLLVDDAGLLTHDLYEPHLFSEYVGAKGAYLQNPSGPGVGFGGLLEKLPWKKLGDG